MIKEDKKKKSVLTSDELNDSDDDPPGKFLLNYFFPSSLFTFYKKDLNTLPKRSLNCFFFVS